MIVVPPNLHALQFHETHHWAICYRIQRELTDDAVFRFTNADHDVEVMTARDSGAPDWSSPSFETFSPANGPSSEAWRRTAGSKGGSGGLFGILDSSNLNEEDFRIGLFEDSRLDVYGVDWRYPWAGPLFHDRYWFADIEWTGARYRVTVENIWSRANRKVGRWFSKTCDATLGDARCTKDISLLKEVATVSSVTSGEERWRFISTATTQGNHYYDLGFLEWQTGNNAITGLNKQQVKRYLNTGEIRLFTPTPYDIEPADQFQITVGCGKEFHKDCRTKHGNKNNFRGWPHLRGADKFLKSPNAKT